MVTNSPARVGSLAVLQLAAAPRDDEASRCRLSLVSNLNGSLALILRDASSVILLFDGGFGVFIGRIGRWFW